MARPEEVTNSHGEDTNTQGEGYFRLEENIYNQEEDSKRP